MRRSKAPSVLKVGTEATYNVFANISNDDNHVKALINTPVPKRPVVGFPVSGVEAQEEPTENCVVYTVVYGRQTTKKHKTFEHDGTLTVRNSKIVLKDVDGKFVGSTGVKEQVESGQRLLIGSFECELIELQNNKRKSPPRVIQTSAKRPKASLPKVIPVVEQPRSSEDSTVTQYNVVWARPTSKKHKTWEGDGILDVVGQKATLKDLSGKVMGTTTLKSDCLTEGTQLFIENKEVQIGSLVKALDVVEKPTPIPVFRPSKKISVTVTTSAEPDLSILLPEPPLEHQWHHNPEENPITPVRVCHNLAQHLREHQKIGVRFIYECVMGFRNELPTDEHYGCILADEMGLGKTIQTLSVLYTLLKGGPYGKCVAKRILIVTPSSLMENWDNEITKWLHQERVFTFIADGKEKIRKFAQSPHIPILLISYEMFVKHFAELAAIRFDVLVCDEAHRLKNQSIKAATQLSQLECRRRILLTGTPIQNDLQEFYALINFANDGLLGTYAEFRQRYEQPIVLSQQPTCLPQGRERGEQRAKELNEITDRFVLRRTQEILQKYLPRKEEVVVFVRASNLQQRLLTEALELYKTHAEIGGHFTALQMITLLKKVCNHPALLRKPNVKEKDIDEVTRALCCILPEWNKMRETDSRKLSLVHAILDEVIERGEKIVLVTYFTSTLTTLEGLCQSLNYKYCRLDGATPASDRGKLVDTFNKPTSEVSVFLLSAKAGGVGLNLIGANRLILFDNDWNPSADLQAMSRIWRDGQQRPCYIYRLITAGTIEEKIFQRQMSKTSLSGCVVDLKQNLKSMKLSAAELKDLFSPADFDVCATHEMLQCGCLANGAIPERSNRESGEESVSPKRNIRFQIGKAKTKAKPALKMHELNKWEHHSGLNLQEQMLKDLYLTAASDDIVFIFRNQNEKK